MLACMTKSLSGIRLGFQIIKISPVGGGAAPKAQLLTWPQDPSVHNTEGHPMIPVHQSAQATKENPERDGATDITFIKCVLTTGPKTLWEPHAWTIIALLPEKNIRR